MPLGKVVNVGLYSPLTFSYTQDTTISAVLWTWLACSGLEWFVGCFLLCVHSFELCERDKHEKLASYLTLIPPMLLRRCSSIFCERFSWDAEVAEREVHSCVVPHSLSLLWKVLLGQKLVVNSSNLVGYSQLRYHFRPFITFSSLDFIYNDLNRLTTIVKYTHSSSSLTDA